MSEYPISCTECEKYMGYVHATRYSGRYICDECNKKKVRELGCGGVVEEVGVDCGDLFEECGRVFCKLCRNDKKCKEVER